MSAWVIGLGVAAGYLVNKNNKVTSRIDNAVASYENAHTDSVTLTGLHTHDTTCLHNLFLYLCRL